MSHKSKHGKNHPPAHHKSDGAEEKTTKRHVYIEPGIQIDVVQDLKNQHQTERREDAATHKQQIFWAKVGAALVLIYALLTLLMYIANKKAANAADSAAKTAAAALTDVQRAFVTFHHINLEAAPPNWRGNKRQWVFTAIVENSGTTPAISKVQYFTGRNDLKNGPSEEQFIGNDKYLPIGEIGPKAQKGMGPFIETQDFVLGNYPLSSVGSEEFHNFFQSRRIFFWGWVGYRDVFQNTRPHVTEFCEEMNGIVVGIQSTTTVRPPRVDPTQLQPRIFFQECQQHNCTDDHCDDYQAIAALVPR